MAEYYSASVSLSHTLSEEDFDSHSFWWMNYWLKEHTTDKKVKMFENCGRNILEKWVNFWTCVGLLLLRRFSHVLFCYRFFFFFLYLYDRFLFVLLFRIRGGHDTKGRCAGRTVYVLRLIANPLVEIFSSLFFLVSSSDGRGYKAEQTVHRKWWKLFWHSFISGSQATQQVFLSF